MELAKQISSADLASSCRMLRMGLSAGLPIVDVFGRQATRGPWSVRPIMARVSDRLAGGDALADALKPESRRLPALFLALVGVGEGTGMLAETFRELEEHYELQHSLKRGFLAQMVWPAINFFGAIFVICLMLWIADIVGSRIDPLGIGTGTQAVIKFLLFVGSITAGLFLIYWGIANRVRFLAPVERLALKLPAVGPALEAVLLSRLSLALRLTLGAGMAVPKALRLSLDAAASALYTRSYERARSGMRRGESLHEILSRCGVFPGDYLDIVANAEEGGQVPEVMERVAKNYQEEAARRLKVLAQVSAWLVYAAVACMIIYLIFRLYGATYGKALKDLEGI